MLTDPQLGFSDAEIARLGNLIDQGLLEIDMIATLPQGVPTQHLGWPVATRLRTGRVVVYRRASGHTDEDDAADAGHYVMFSDDMVNWQPQPPIRLGTLPGMHCVSHAAQPDGGDRLLAITSSSPRILYTSEDYGGSWQMHRIGSTGCSRPRHVGPNMINHPDFGVVVTFGQENNGGRRCYLLNSTDAGETWNEVWLNRPGSRGFEPTLATWGPGHMVMISRKRDSFAVGPDGLFGHSQHVYQHRAGAPFRQVKFETQRLNIVGGPAVGSACNDTAEVAFNRPGRIEVLQSHRWGGGLGKTGTTIESPRTGNQAR
ncbi:MAG: sialidase family protein [Phycisphaerales bacterium]